MNTPDLNPASPDSLKTLRQVSLIFFFIIGGAHIFSSLLASNNLILPVSNIISRILDIPFLIIGCTLALSQSRIPSDSPRLKSYYIIMAAILLLVLGLLLYINLLVPDKII